MIKVTKKLSIFTVLVLTICLLVGSVIAFATDNKVYTIRFAHGLPGTHWMGMEYAKWGKMVNEESNGRLKVEVYSGGQLYNDKKLISAVKTAACEMGSVYTFTLGTIIPEFKSLAIPFVLKNRDDFLKTINGDLGKELFGKIEEKGLKPLEWVVWGLSGPEEEQGIISTTPVHVPSDLKGKIIRVISSEQIQYVQEYCGASTTYVSGAELYMAFQRGTLNATFAGISHLVDRKLYEVAPYFTIFPHADVCSVMIMNKQFYDKLPEELQQVIINVSGKIQKDSEERSRYINKVYFLKAKELVRGRGEIYLPTNEEMALWSKNIVDYWKEVTEGSPETFDLIMRMQNL